MINRLRSYGIIAAIMTLVFIAFVFWSNFQSREHIITVVNAGYRPIDALIVTVCDIEYFFQNLPHGSQSQQTFVISGDSGFLVRGKFIDGIDISGGFGYVTKSYSRQHVEIVVHSDGSVTGKQSKKRKRLHQKGKR